VLPSVKARISFNQKSHGTFCPAAAAEPTQIKVDATVMAAEKLDTTAEGIAKRMREAEDVEDATTGEAQRRLAGAVEDLRVKYEKIDAEKAAKAKEDEKQAVQVEQLATKAAAKADAVAMEGDAGEVEDEGDGDGDDDAELRAIREKRLKQMKRAQEKKRQAKLAGHGQYNEISEDDFLSEVSCRLSLGNDPLLLDNSIHCPNDRRLLAASM
jgi:hypothetical protein